MKPPSTIRCSVLSVVVFAGVVACGRSAPPPGMPGSPHGKLTELSRVKGSVLLCAHKVPAGVCTLDHPELVSQFKRAGDWCAPHSVPESQCLECHPDLTFEPLPELPPTADVAWLSRAGEDVPSLEAHAVPGKVTVFEFYAEWCAACRKVDGHMYKKLASGEARLAYRKLNIGEWESALAQRYIRDVPSLPYVVVYDVNGKRAATVTGADLAALDRTLANAAAAR